MNRAVLLAFVIVLAIYGGVEYWLESRRSPEFAVQLLQLDTTAISTIEIRGPEAEAPLLLTQTGQGWVATYQQVNLPARPEAINTFFDGLHGLRTQRIAGRGESGRQRTQWDEKRLIHLRVNGHSGVLEDVLLWAAIEPDTHPDVTGYLQLQGQAEIYAVTGAAPDRLPLYLNDFRPREFVRLPADFDVVALRDEQRDTTFHYRRAQQRWLRHDDHPADSLAVEQLLRNVQQVDGRYFADDVDELGLHRYHQRRLLLFDARGDSITIDLYRDSLRVPSFILHSSQYPKTWLASDADGVYRLIFPLLDSLGLNH